MSTTETTASKNTELDRMMVAVAQRRGIVRLVDGQLATLLSWGTPKPGRRVSSGNRVRLEATDGVRHFTRLKRDIIEVVDVDA